MPSRNKERTLRAVQPSAAIRDRYRAKLDRLIREMQRSVEYWLGAAYKRNDPEVRKLALDASPAVELQAVTRRLARRWQRRFTLAARELAIYFATDASKRNDAALRSILKRGGFSVEFRMTRAMNDVLQATINENVALIQSIPAHYFTEVEGLVMRSVTAGRDIGFLYDELRKRYGITRRRAALISRDQNNKVSINLQTVRYQEIGFTEGIWRHSNAGKEPRPTHLKAGHDQVRFNLAEGWFDPDPKVKRYIHCGELVNCRCYFVPVLPVSPS